MFFNIKNHCLKTVLEMIICSIKVWFQTIDKYCKKHYYSHSMSTHTLLGPKNHYLRFLLVYTETTKHLIILLIAYLWHLIFNNFMKWCIKCTFLCYLANLHYIWCNFSIMISKTDAIWDEFSKQH